jgi:hypothetical protein
MRFLILALALIAFPAHAQTVEERLEKARTEINTIENAADRALYACERGNRDKCLLEVRTAGNAASRALYAVDQALETVRAEDPHDGHEMPDQPVFEPLTTADITPIASNFDTAAWLNANAIPSSAAPDVVGAFRFICNTSHSNFDDPIVYPGQPGKAHLHGFFGNTGTDAFSTYDTLRKSGDGTCHGGPLNRSAYWKPELLDAAGNIVREDHIVVYYKRRPKTDPACAIEGKACVGIPPGLRTIFGTNYSTGEDTSPHVVFRCNGPTGDDVKHPTLGPAAANCAPGNKILATIHTARCWDGVNLDSPDHQSHLAHQLRNRNTGQPYCPTTHPYIIPEVTLTFTWAVLPGDDPKTWIFSSDIMAGKPAGSTFHADYMEAWDPQVRLAWEAACIDKLLNCSDGTLGDGRKMRRPAGFTFEQRTRP